MSQFLKDMAHGPRIIIVTGHFGSGKTEFSVSLAFALAAMQKQAAAYTDKNIPVSEALALCDLDIENPYFRSRELTETLEAEGIRVYSDPYHGRNGSELQTLDPGILAPIENPNCRVILDTGGNSQGAMILNQFKKQIGDNYRMLYVVNQNRPGTDAPEKILSEIKDIEQTTGLHVSGLISNSHFIRQTTPEDVTKGYEFALKAGSLCSLPVLCACCSINLVQEVRAHIDSGLNTGEVCGIPDTVPQLSFDPHTGEAGHKKTDGEIEIFPIGMYMRQSYLDRKV